MIMNNALKECETEYRVKGDNAIKILDEYFRKKPNTERAKMAKKALNDLTNAYAAFIGMYEWMKYEDIAENETEKIEEA